MRPIFLEATKQLEYEDALFQQALSSHVMLATSLETWAVAREVAQKLYELIRTHRPRQILEVGTSLGYSTIWMAEATREYGGKIITLEKEPEKIAKTQKLFDELGYQETIALFNVNATEFLHTFQNPIDFLFLDAQKREYLSYLEACEPRLSSGALVVADDVVEWKRKMEDFLEYIENSKQYKSQVFSLGHGLLVAQKVD